MKRDTIENGAIAIKGIVAAIPTLGSTIASVWSDIEALQAKRKQERLEEYFVALHEEVEVLKDKINFTYINQPDFLDIFELTSQYIVNERTEEKRIFFRNILISSFINEDCSYDKTERFLRILDQMNYLELLILKALQDPERFNEQNGEIIKDPNWIKPGVRNGVQFSMAYNFVEMLSELLHVSKEDVAEAVYFLEANRLVLDNVSLYKLQTNGHPIHTIKDKLTSKGKNFVSFIIR